MFQTDGKDAHGWKSTGLPHSTNKKGGTTFSQRDTHWEGTTTLSPNIKIKEDTIANSYSCGIPKFPTGEVQSGPELYSPDSVENLH